MPKRPFSFAMDASSPPPPSPPSPVALPFMPGQWDKVYIFDEHNEQQADTQPASRVFATMGRFVPSLYQIADLVGATCRRFFARRAGTQQIEAVPVSRPDGARKRLLLDAGISDPSTPPNSRAQPASIRRALNAPSQQLLNKHNTAASDDVWTSPSAWVAKSSSKESQYNGIATSPENTGSPCSISTGSPNSNIDDSLDLSFENCLTSTPRQPEPQPSPTPPTGNANLRTPSYNPFHAHNYPASLGQSRYGSIKRNTIAQLHHGSAHRPGYWPVRNEIGAGSPAGPICAPLRSISAHNPAVYVRQLASPFIGSAQHVQHPRIQALASPGGMHTQRNYLSRGMDDTEIVVSHARAEDPAFRNNFHTNQNTNTLQDTPLPWINVPSEEGDDDDDENYGSFFSEGPAKIGTPMAYENDLSFLSDAPPLPTKKRVLIDTFSRNKPFYKDRTILELLDEDSFITFTKNDPKDEAVDVSSLSIEVTKSLQSQAKPPPSPPSTAPLISPLSEEEEKVLDTAVKKATSSPKPIDLVEGKLSSHDFATLLPRRFNGNPMAWLNDNIVNEYLAILVDHVKAEAGYVHRKDGPAPPVHAFASQWYGNMRKSYKSVARWATRKQLGGRQLLDANLILIPICDGAHWRLVAIKPKDRIIQYLDSLSLKPGLITDTVHDWLENELGPHYNKSEWTTQDNKESSIQLNGSDCGVFTCLNALTLLRDDDFNRVIPDNGMVQARERIAVSLLNRKHTGEMN